MTDRRRFLFGLAGGATALAMPSIARAQAPAKFLQPALPYVDTTLAPTIGQQTVQLHFSRHHAAKMRHFQRVL